MALLLVLTACSEGATELESRLMGYIERAQPLIAAIRTYEKDHGYPPRDLGELVDESGVEAPDGLRYYVHQDAWSVQYEFYNDGLVDMTPEFFIYNGTERYEDRRSGTGFRGWWLEQ